MRHNREFWTRHVKDWRASGLTQAQYCRRHRLTRSTFGYWAWVWKKPNAIRSTLVEVGRAEVKLEQPHSPIELIVERRYLLRLWPGMGPDHLRDVLLVLERGA